MRLSDIHLCISILSFGVEYVIEAFISLKRVAKYVIIHYFFFFYFRNEENDEDATTAALTLTHESLFPSEGELAQLCTSLNSVTHIIISLMELLVRKSRTNILP